MTFTVSGRPAPDYVVRVGSREGYAATPRDLTITPKRSPVQGFSWQAATIDGEEMHMCGLRL
jgi:hypothetical protein